MRLATCVTGFMILAFLLGACAGQAGRTQTAPTGTMEAGGPSEVKAIKPAQLNVFAAASLAEAFLEIGKELEAEHPGVRVTFNFAGSQQLAQQISAGAPADVFASANDAQMEVAIAAGEILSGTQQNFARNRLVVIYPQENPAGLKALTDLAKPGLKLILASKEVPVGTYSLAFLDKASGDPAFGAAFKDEVLGNVASYEDNVRTVLTKVALGEADAGIVYGSDVSGENGGKVGSMDIPEPLNVMASYPIAPLKSSSNPEVAKAFIDLVLSTAGQDILAKYNFMPVR